MSVHSWGNIAYLAMGIGMLLMALLFLGFTRWWKDPVGRSIGTFFIAVSCIMCFGVSVVSGAVDVGTSVFEWTRLALYGVLAFAVWGLVIGFVTAQFLRVKRRKEDTSRNPIRGGTVER